MESSGYTDQHEADVRTGKGVRLAAAPVVQRGRWREFRRTLLIAAVLVALQWPARQVVEGDLDSAFALSPAVPGRISLIIDVLFVLAYLFVAYRAFGLMRSCRPPGWALRVNQLGLVLVFVGALLDLVEDTRLWVLLGDGQAGLTVGFGQLFGDGDKGDGYTLLMRAVVGVGFVLQAVSFFGFRRARDDDKARPALAKVKDPRHGGTVICCSGGGIRSSAFSLGGLQAFTQAGIYQDARAVVGVSGGGYVGAAYHVLRWNPGDRTPAPDGNGSTEWKPGARPEDPPDEEPSGEPAFAPSSPEMKWLRRHTGYVLNGIRIAAQGALSLMFGIAVNLLLIAAVVGGSAWLLAWLMLASGRLMPWEGTSISGTFGSDWTFLEWVWVVPVAGVAFFVLEKAWDRVTTVPFHARSALRAVAGYLLGGGLVLTGLVLAVPAAVAALGEYAATSGSIWAGLLHQLGLVPTSVCREALETTSACGVDREQSVAGTSMATVPGVSIATVVASILAVLASAKSAASESKGGGSGVTGFLGKIWAKIKDPIVPWAALAAVVVIVVGVLLRWVAALVADPTLLSEWRFAGWFAVLLLATKLVTDANRTSLHHFFRERISYAFLVRRTGNGVQPVPYRRPLRFSEALPPAGRGPHLVACAVANVSDEEIVPSRRGCVPFVFDHRQIGLTDQLLPDGAARRVSATYEFAADARYRDATIPAAVAMSAAAFSPLAGRENVRLGPYRAVMALGNARLGVWLPNPLWVDELGLVRRLARLQRWHEAALIAAALPLEEYVRLSEQIRSRVDPVRPPEPDEPEESAEAKEARDAAWAALEALPQQDPWYAVAGELARAFFKKPGVTRLAKEGFGKASVYDRYLYVTDGGHYDNLGLIEALRRRPDTIYVLDASNDAEDTFRTLGRAIATARMDLDCEVEMDPRGMRRLSQTRSGAAWCRGSYRYGDGTTGTVFLSKAILLDNLPWDIEAYAADNLDFPRTSTGNQLYSEFDFEAYRELGITAVTKLLASDEHAPTDAAAGDQAP